MERDYSFRVPQEYRADEQGFVEMDFYNGSSDVPPSAGGLF